MKLIRKKSKNANVFVERLDLASFDSVKDFADRVLSREESVNILINNAGLMSNQRWVTKDGFEYQFQVNYLSHYLLTRLLLDRLAASSPSRIINVTSKLYESAELDWSDLNFEKNFNATKGYQRSKLCNILLTNYLKDNVLTKTSNENITAYSVSPGIVLTNLGRHLTSGVLAKLGWFLFYPLIWLFMKTAKQGATTSIYCATQPNLVELEGHYFRDCKQIALVSPHANNKEDSAR